MIVAALAETRPLGPRTVAEELRIINEPELEMWEAPLVVANIGDSRAVLGECLQTPQPERFTATPFHITQS